VAKILTIFRNAKLSSLPEKKNGKNGEFYSFVVTVDDQKFKIICFDDERDKNPFKKLDNALNAGNIGRGTYISMECELSRYPAYAISEEKWKSISSEANPTKVALDNFKLEDWEYAVPYEIHQKMKDMKEKGNELPAPATLLPLGDEGGLL